MGFLLDEEKEYYTGLISTGSRTINNGSLVSGVNWIIGSSTGGTSLGSALAFGSPSFISVSGLNISSYNQLSITCWINQYALGNQTTIIDQVNAGPQNGIQLTQPVSFASGNLAFTVYSGVNPNIIQCGSYTTGIWVHLGVTINNTTGSYFGYGNGIVTSSGNSVYMTPATAGINLAFGYRTNSSIRYFSGALDDVRIYNRQLTSTEIGQIYSGTSITGSLVGYWNFDEGTGSIANDSNINNFSYYTDTINGKIDSVEFLPSGPVTIGSMIIAVSGTNELISVFTSGIPSSNYTIKYPKVYAADNNLNSGSPWSDTQIVNNSPISITGSNMYDSKIKIRYR